jgi:predicted MPP superfamily phosphohydrolase
MILYLIAALLILVGLTVLLGSHYFLYFSIIHFFHISNVSQDHVVLGVLFFLSISFIIFSILAHFLENLLTRLFYFLSGFWLGLLTNLFLASLAVWIIIGFSHLLGIVPNTAFLGGSLYILALAYSIYGVFNAFSIRLKNISATIPGLPDAWKGKRIIQVSDLHIGHIFKNNFMRKVAAMINSEHPEMVVITGDLFDGMDGDLSDPLSSLNTIETPKGIFFITGNHETFLGAKFVSDALHGINLRILKDEVVDVDGLKLVGVSYPEQGESKTILSALEKLKDGYIGKPNILLYHAPESIKKIKDTGINLQLSGHTHKGQIYPFNFFIKLFFRGYDYGLHVMGDYTLYVTNGTGTWGPTMRTGNTPEIVVITLA